MELNVKQFPKHPMIECFDEEIQDLAFLYGYSIEISKYDDDYENEKEIYKKLRMKIINLPHFCRELLTKQIQKYLNSQDISEPFIIYDLYRRCENTIVASILKNCESHNNLDYVCIMQMIFRDEYENYFIKHPNLIFFKVKTN